MGNSNIFIILLSIFIFLVLLKIYNYHISIMELYEAQKNKIKFGVNALKFNPSKYMELKIVQHNDMSSCSGGKVDYFTCSNDCNDLVEDIKLNKECHLECCKVYNEYAPKICGNKVNDDKIKC